jgi:SET domain-containing protein
MLLVKTKLNTSCIHGVGLFADEFIAEGTVIWKFHPLIDLRLTEKQINQLAEPACEQIKKYTYREMRTGLYVLCGDDARFFNHSADPNCLDFYHNEEEDLTVAHRNINTGEELTCNYALFDLDLVEGKYSI